VSISNNSFHCIIAGSNYQVLNASEWLRCSAFESLSTAFLACVHNPQNARDITLPSSLCKRHAICGIVKFLSISRIGVLLFFPNSSSPRRTFLPFSSSPQMALALTPQPCPSTSYCSSFSSHPVNTITTKPLPGSWAGTQPISLPPHSSPANSLPPPHPPSPQSLRAQKSSP
jgi:hypothetical protein